ncbi:MAG: helix-hairpin-helix domain-containing protein [Pseudomonas sp.]|uniref:helix-hairpin-helix domain-containing protein n=1 Tax=Pseudomonas sp. TaxID=306 RepID=UPI003981AA80
MAFTEAEKLALLSLKGVGPTVIKRLEEIGIDSLAQLATYRAEDLAEMVAAMLHSTCWKNSPQARAALNAAIGLAKGSL